MELRHPGQYARQRVNRMLVAAAVVAGLSIPLVMLLGLPAIAGPSLFVLVIVLWHRSDIRETRNWHKGAVGEESVGRALARLEPMGFRTLHDLETRHGNIDHVVIGPTGVFALETKAWRARVYCGRDGHLMVGGVDQERAISQAMRGAMEVRARLNASGLGTWVEAAIVLTARELPSGKIRRGKVTVIELGELTAFVMEGPKRLDPLAVARLRAAIFRNRPVQHP